MSITRRIFGVALLAALCGGVVLSGCGGAGRNQAAPNVAIFNLLSHPILDSSIAGIRAGLAEAGYSGDRIRITEVNANGEMDKLSAFAREIVASKPAIIVPVSTPVAQAVLKEAPAQQQVVFSTVTNPADIGMDRKPANATGVSDLVNYAANLDLIRQLFPHARRIGMIYNAGERNSQFGVDAVKRLAPERGFELRLATVSKSDEVVNALRGLLESVDVIYVGSDNTVVSAIEGLTKTAYDRKVPVVASDVGSVTGGALAAVSVDYRALGRKVGEIVAGLLKSGANAGSVAPVGFLGDALILNESAAARLGIQFPDSLRQRAAQVIH
jgi:putative tryptophan/tyrosine transport system substrate-binding protein